MADKADDVQDDQILAALKDDEQESSKAESSPAEDKKPEVAKDAKEAKPKEDAKPEAPPEPADKESKEEPEAKADEEADADKPTEEDKPQGKAEERKTQLNTEIRDLVAKRNALKAEVEKANAEVYQPAAEDELTDQTNPETGQPYTSLEAKIEAMRQQQEMEKYNTQVAEAQLTIESESQRVLNDFPVFNPDSSEYDKELAEETSQLLSSNLILDPNTNQVIGSHVSPYQLYKTVARAHQSSTVKGQIKGREETEQMLANADSASNAAPIAKAKDPVLEILKSDDY